MDSASESVVVTISVGSVVGALLLGIFVIFRNAPIYCPRLHKRLVSAKQWLSLPDDEVIGIVGLDAYILLRFLKFFALIMSVAATIGLIVLVPLYASGRDEDGVQGISRLSLANVKHGDIRLHATMLFSYMFTLLFLHLIGDEYKVFAKLRQRHMSQVEGDKALQHLYSIRVENIPLEHRTSEKLKALFEKIFPRDVHSAVVAATLTSLHPLLKTRALILSELEATNGQLDTAESSTERDSGLQTALVSPQLSGLLAKRNKLQRELDYYNMQVSSVEEEARSVQHATSQSSTGFVTFLSLRSFRASQQPILFDAYPSLQVTPATLPTDIIWRNISVPQEAVEAASAAVRVCYYFGLFLWICLVVVLTALSSVATLLAYFPMLQPLPEVYLAVIAGLLPSVVLVLLMNSLPLFFQWVDENVTQRKSQSDIQRQVLEWFFLYQLVNVYTGALSTSAFLALYETTDLPSFFYFIASTLPASSVFFINVIVTQLLIVLPARILRWIQLIQWVSTRLSPAAFVTARQVFQGPLAPAVPDYDQLIPVALFVLCASVVYWVIAPILLPFAALFFIVQYLVFKHQALYVNEAPFETGGSFFYPMFTFSMASLLTSSLLNIAFIAVKHGAVQAPLMLPLPVIILIGWERIELKYKLSSEYLAFSRAVDVDNKPRIVALENAFDSNYFCQPVLRQAPVAEPYTHRKGAPRVPLIDSLGQVSGEYWEDSDLFNLS